MNTLTVNDINNKVLKDPCKFIKECEDDFSKDIEKIADRVKKEKIKFIFISGPSSAGKTTSAKKFTEFFKDYDLIDISLDDYYKKQKKMPLRKDHSFNYESIYSLRLNDMKEDFTNLLKGKSVYIPIVDFMTGKHIENGEKVKLTDKSVVVIEGLHALNPKVYNMMKGERILKVFIYPKPPIIKNDKLVSKYDFRFVRRFVRDSYYRNSGIINSLKMWPEVRAAEKIYMPLYEKRADIVLNTFLNYEPCVLKEDALRLLSTVTKESPYYLRARRLYNTMKVFEPLSTKYVPQNSLLREFIKND